MDLTESGKAFTGFGIPYLRGSKLVKPNPQNLAFIFKTHIYRTQKKSNPIIAASFNGGVLRLAIVGLQDVSQ
tara:strand:- start:604 stop:819 length:216 start_codon:yes stop_codon:yes gene_type:complete